MESKRPSAKELTQMSPAELIFLINQLFDIIYGQNAEINQVKQKITEIEDRATPAKNSRNSSQSPASDLKRKHKTGDETGKKGPPRGHKGTSRKISAKPDIILNLPITECHRTHQPVQSQSNSYKRHQIIEIEPAKVIIIELRRQITTGPDGKTLIAPNPEGIKNHQRYGSNLKTQVAYLRFELNVSWRKIWNYLKDMAGITIGIGTLKSIFHELKADLEAEYNALQAEIKTAPIVNSDETGFHVNGDKWWIHLARTDDLTIFAANKSRGHKVTEEIIGKDFAGILVTDFWGGYNPKFFSKATFQKCVGAHLLRDLEYAIECESGKGNYAQQLFNVVFDAVLLKKFFIFDTPEYREECLEKETRLDALLADNVDTVTKVGKRLWKRLRKYRTHLFNFLYVQELAADNNAGERDIRDIVMARKMSGGYRTESGIEELSIGKSIISTYKKRGDNFVNRFRSAFGTPVFNPG